MNWLDFAVLIGSLVGIAAYGVWRTRGRRSLNTYLKGDQNLSWLAIGISVMATQASAITFISTPGQGYLDGLGFVQNYFGMPLALIIIAVAFLPIYRRLNVYTAYEYLGQRFDTKTRLLGAILFLLQRGLNAGITIYAPAIILSSVLGWRLDLTILLSGLVVIVYTVTGGSQAVSLTQKYQLAVIFGGMVTAFIILLVKLPTNFTDALTIAGSFNKLRAVDFSLDPNKRYTFWSGTLGGIFLMLAYFGTDQSQVQRYISGSSLGASKLGLMFNAVLKIPMQFLILLLGVLMFVFFQFETPPIFFNQVEWQAHARNSSADTFHALEDKFAIAQAEKQQLILRWLDAKHSGPGQAESAAKALAVKGHERSEKVRAEAKSALQAADPRANTNDGDYVFITFIMRYLPHGLIGLLIAAFFAAALSSKAAELNALSSTTTVDLYRQMIRPNATDAHYVLASKFFTFFWGLLALAFALFASMTENLIQAANILGSLFYGVMLGLFLVAFFLKWVGGTAVFWGAMAAEAVVVDLHITHQFKLFDPLHISDRISYLWYNPIGCILCVLFGVALQAIFGFGNKTLEAR